MKKQTIQKEMPGLKKQTFLVSAAITMYFDFSWSDQNFNLSGTFSLQPLLIVKHILAIPKNQQSLYST